MTPRKSSTNERKVNTYRPFSKITSHIDPMVLYTFLSLLAISIVILAFQISGREDCSLASIHLSSQQHAGKRTSFTTGEVITFKAENAGKIRSDISWDFGDSTEQAQGLQVYHAFNKAGNYTITLLKGKCSWHQEVIILNAVPDNTPPATSDLFPVIEGPSEVLAGRAVTYSNNSSASKWQWRLLQRGAETHSGKTVSYTFATPGERILTLIVDGDTSKMVTKHIQVFPAQAARRNDHFEPMPFPEPEKPADPAAGAQPVPEKPKTPTISDDEFKYMLTQVIDKQKNAGDFSPFLCENLNARVLLNDKDTDSFSHFCSRIRGKKRFKIELVNLIKDQNGCVKEIRIRYDKKFLGIF
ncbi:hypothetical protein SAMN05518672_104262 [Chitinophaga sp. CF118]|uniref:PKD domain-containing protein n=1 Tax=Chitinophaga sp. CF118 TaxID=1884367 RepID=UPI0008E1FE04|nr:PKD domain-containing protein [Chitinophaga sp. CF118]SFE04793.1 hypothetical protein SAMN05518672_104262 [Chitinophaga sp. CF118]